MDPSPSIDRAFEGYGHLAYYDRFYPPIRVEEDVKADQTLTGSSSSLYAYTSALVDLFGFTETSSLSVNPVDFVIKRTSDEELWLGLIGIFESGDPHFAEQHDQVYGQRA